MKLTDLIPPRMGGTGIQPAAFNLAIDQMEMLTALVEQAGYRLVLAMPQHPISEDDDQ